MSYYYAKAEEVLGPKSLEDLAELYRAGEISADTQVCTDGGRVLAVSFGAHPNSRVFQGGVLIAGYGLRSFTFTLAGRTELSEEAHACLDCGLVWSSTAPEKLAAFIKKHCDRTSDTASA